MEFTWPRFEARQPLPDGRTWTAELDSYDQYREDCYYLVTIYDAARADTIMVRVGLEFAGDDWMRDDFIVEVRKRIAEVAVTGKTNTPHGG
ncbi:MAG: hypothetical protein H0V17_05960 [Deltaproteobacteria bacterium]|nr:hypothetical protein [Deltaproteobacteria bacterium]